ncbi:MAG: hypothetical protein ACE5I9_08620 [Candidatus Methylomirabilales bacterium]
MAYLNEIQIDRDLLLEFFLHFSRFEFALKTAGFAHGDLDSVHPSWDDFAVSIRDQFDKSVNTKLLEACNYILDDPPRKQVLLNGGLAWKTQAQPLGQSEVEFLLRMVRCIRNNLFHGGKHNVALHEDRVRSETLLRNSLVILDECLRLSPDVKRAFDGAVI